MQWNHIFWKLQGHLCSPWELSMCQNETFQPDRELHVTTSHHILDFEVKKFCLQYNKIILTLQNKWSRLIILDLIMNKEKSSFDAIFLYALWLKACLISGLISSLKWKVCITLLINESSINHNQESITHYNGESWALQNNAPVKQVKLGKSPRPRASGELD